MNKALLDTDMVSEIGKSRDQVVAINAKSYRRSFGHYTLSTVTVMEVVRGLQKTQAIARLNAFLATLPYMELLVLDVTPPMKPSCPIGASYEANRVHRPDGRTARAMSKRFRDGRQGADIQAAVLAYLAEHGPRPAADISLGLAALGSNDCIRRALGALVEQGRVTSGIERFTQPSRMVSGKGGCRSPDFLICRTFLQVRHLPQL